MKCSQIEFDAIHPKLKGLEVTKITMFEKHGYLTNSFQGHKGVISNIGLDLANYGRAVHHEWNENTFLEACDIKPTQQFMSKYINTTISKAQLKKIYDVACTSWQTKIMEFAKRIDFLTDNITFNEQEIDAMFTAATADQYILLESIFGLEDEPVIEWDKIKTGSQVMIKQNGKHCNGFEKIDADKPVNVIFYKTPYLLDHKGFTLKSSHSSYTSFEQNGKFVLFSSESDMDYITKVISY